MLPMSNLVILVNGLMYEHWLYAPMAGILLIVVWYADELAARYHARQFAAGLLVAWCAVLGTLTLLRNRDWKDPVVFYNQVLQYSPNSYRVCNNLGMCYANRNLFNDAESMYRRAYALEPANPVAIHNLGNLYKARGQIDGAIQLFNAALQAQPGFAHSCNALAEIYLRTGKPALARAVLEQRLPAENNKVGLLLLLAQIAYQEKNNAETMRYLEQAHAIDPANADANAGLQALRAPQRNQP
jgi:tetratricopeptide (TPR) repeat protein